MKITDEMLSAYLDNELSPTERAQIDDAIGSDPAVAARLDQFASVDALLGRQAALIDSVPMPEAVLTLLNSQPTSTSASNVVQLSAFQRGRQRISTVLREHAALAASLALLLGFAGGQMLSPAAPVAGIASADPLQQLVGQALDRSPSGQTYTFNSAQGELQLTARFSFTDAQARFCRQYVLQDNEGSSENVACREQGQWQSLASVRLPGSKDSAGQYRTASGPGLLDTVLDTLMQGPALNREDEQRAIDAGWTPL